MEIPGLGYLSTSWIGKRGQDELVETMKRHIEATKVTELKKELKTLASVCLQGLTSGEMQDVKQAVNLCHQYVPKVKATPSNASTTLVADSTDKIEHATEVLGEKIVAKITENHRDPPHVSQYFECTHYL